MGTPQGRGFGQPSRDLLAARDLIDGIGTVRAHGLSNAQIATLESELAVSLPQTYVIFLRTFGKVDLPELRVLGRAADGGVGPEDVADATRTLRASGEIGRGEVVIAHDDQGRALTLRCDQPRRNGECPIGIASHAERIFEDFGEFLLARVTAAATATAPPPPPPRDLRHRLVLGTWVSLNAPVTFAEEVARIRSLAHDLIWPVDLDLWVYIGGDDSSRTYATGLFSPRVSVPKERVTANIGISAEDSLSHPDPARLMRETIRAGLIELLERAHRKGIAMDLPAEVAKVETLTR